MRHLPSSVAEAGDHYSVTDYITLALPNNAEKEASAGQLTESLRQKLSRAVPGLNNRTVFVPTAGMLAAEVIAGPGKDAQKEGREGVTEEAGEQPQL